MPPLLEHVELALQPHYWNRRSRKLNFPNTKKSVGSRCIARDRSGAGVRARTKWIFPSALYGLMDDALWRSSEKMFYSETEISLHTVRQLEALSC